MSLGHKLLWALEFIIVFSALFAAQLPLRKRKLPVVNAIVFAVKAFLILYMPVLFINVDNWFTYRCADLIAVMDIVIISDVVASIVEFVVRKVRQRRDKSSEKQPCQTKLIAVTGAVVCICVALYGSINARDVVMNEHTWTAEGLKQPHTFAFASDIHAEDDHMIKNLMKFRDQVNAVQPEFVIIGGDVTDEKTSYEEMVEAWKIISEINVPVYFVYGNHESQPDARIFGGRTYTDEQLVENIKAAGVTIVVDEYVKVADDLILLGRNDMSKVNDRKPWSEIVNPYEGEGAVIVADHQPHDKDQLNNLDAALQLSGHLHAGQLWPLQSICRAMGTPVLGEYYGPHTKVLYMTSGTGGWAIPFRTESDSVWELITLTP